jgi:hypothetical protein
MESEIRQQIAKETEAEFKRMEEIYLSCLKREVKPFTLFHYFSIDLFLL